MDMHVGDAQRRKPSSSTPRLSLDLAWTWTSILRGSGRQMRAGNLRCPGANYILPNIISHNLRYFRGDDLVGIFSPPVAETSTSPDRERHADRAVIFAFSCYARIARSIQSISRYFARRGSAIGFFATPYSSPRCVEYRAGYPRHWKCTPSG
jgi:hypothetical protein